MSFVRTSRIHDPVVRVRLGRYREAGSDREITYIEEKGTACGQISHRRNQPVGSDRVAHGFGPAGMAALRSRSSPPLTSAATRSTVVSYLCSPSPRLVPTSSGVWHLSPSRLERPGPSGYPGPLPSRIALPRSSQSASRDCASILATASRCSRRLQESQASIGVVVTSPPYNIGVKYRSYQDDIPRSDYLNWTDGWLRAASKVMTPDASLFLNVETTD